MIEMHNITKTYQVGKNQFSALTDVSLSVQKGEMVAIQGRSGAGKTTLFNLLGCLDTFDTGKYFLDGHQVDQMKDRELAAIRCRKIGFVLQEFALINHQSVFFNIMLPLFFDRVPYRKMTRSVEGSCRQSKWKNRRQETLTLPKSTRRYAISKTDKRYSGKKEQMKTAETI